MVRSTIAFLCFFTLVSVTNVRADQSLPDISEKIEKLLPLAEQFGPENFNSIFSGISSMSVYPELSTKFDHSNLGIGKGVYLPVNLKTRKSVYVAPVSMPVITGIFVGSEGVYYRRFTRLNGSDRRAAAGDLFRFEIIDIENKPIVAVECPLKLAKKPTKGYLNCADPNVTAASVWVIWSGIKVDD